MPQHSKYLISAFACRRRRGCRCSPFCIHTPSQVDTSSTRRQAPQETQASFTVTESPGTRSTVSQKARGPSRRTIRTAQQQSQQKQTASMRR